MGYGDDTGPPPGPVTYAGVALVATPIIFKDELFPADEPGCRSGEVCTGVSTSF